MGSSPVVAKEMGNTVTVTAYLARGDLERCAAPTDTGSLLMLMENLQNKQDKAAEDISGWYAGEDADILKVTVTVTLEGAQFCSQPKPW